MEEITSENIGKYFGYVTSIIYWHEWNGEFESYEEMLRQYPKSRLGMSLHVRQNAYKALQWVMQNPEADFMSLDPWMIKDNASYFVKMKELYDFMTKHKMFE